MSDEARVLVVDDNVDLAENISEILETEGLECDVADSGELALELLEKNVYGLVITDLKMEGMSGLDVLRAVSSKWPQIPVLIMTAYARDRTVDRARSEGAIDVVPKPIDIASLLTVVQRLVSAHGRVLVVEDDDDLRENLVEVLDACEQFETDAVASLQSALQSIEGQGYDVVVIDLRLPDGSGLRLAQQLHERLGERCPALVFTSAHSEEIGQALQQVAQGVRSEVLRKPFSPAMLVSLVRKAV